MITTITKEIHLSKNTLVHQNVSKSVKICQNVDKNGCSFYIYLDIHWGPFLLVAAIYAVAMLPWWPWCLSPTTTFAARPWAWPRPSWEVTLPVAEKQDGAFFKKTKSVFFGITSKGRIYFSWDALKMERRGWTMGTSKTHKRENHSRVKLKLEMNRVKAHTYIYNVYIYIPSGGLVMQTK